MNTKEITLITALLIAIISVTDMATDLFVPTLPNLVDYFDSDESTISWTISCALFGFCLSAPLYGPLSDTYGRRRMFLVGLGVFSLGNLACSFAFSPEALMVAQFLQGTGQTVGYVVGIAMVRDLYSREQFSKIMSLMQMVVSLTPAIAPIIGSYVGQYYGWQTNFIGLFLIGCFLMLMTFFMPETVSIAQRKEFSIQKMRCDYTAILTSKYFMGNSFISAIIYSGLWIYMAEAPHIFEKLFVERTNFGYYSAFLAVLFIVGATINNRTIEKYGIDLVFKVSLYTCFCGSLVFTITNYVYPESSIIMCASLSLFAVGIGGVFANATTGAMEQFPDQKGTAAAALACIENLVPAIVLTIMGYFYDRTTLPISIGLIITTTLALFIRWWLYGQPHTVKHEQI